MTGSPVGRNRAKINNEEIFIKVAMLLHLGYMIGENIKSGRTIADANARHLIDLYEGDQAIVANWLDLVLHAPDPEVSNAIEVATRISKDIEDDLQPDDVVIWHTFRVGLRARVLELFQDEQWRESTRDRYINRCVC